MSLWMLPPTQRQALFALYAFARHTDDIADDEDSPAHATDSRSAALQTWRTALHETLARRDERIAARADATEFSYLPALADSARRYSIPSAHFESLIDGVTRDLDARDFPDFPALKIYCEQVASSVGLACMHIWTDHPQTAYPAATECGIAFQLTNILRDLREDAQRDPLYVPLDLLDELKLPRDELFRIVREGRHDRRYELLIERMSDVAERAYRVGWETRQALRGRSRRCFELMFHTYHQLLDKIRKSPYAAAQRRLRLSRPHKAWIALTTLCGVPPRFAATRESNNDFHKADAP